MFKLVTLYFLFQVNLAIGISEGLVTVNNQILPVKELKTFQLEAEISKFPSDDIYDVNTYNVILIRQPKI